MRPGNTAAFTATLALMALSSAARSAAATLPDGVLEWNRIALQTQADLKDPRTPPAARALAMVHVAIYDAVNSVDRRHAPYAGFLNAAPGASTEAATAAAAHGVLVGLYPSQKVSLDAAYSASLEPMPADASRADGIALGDAAAARVLALRADDGAAVVPAYTVTFSPGVWQPLPPANAAAWTGWGKVMPFTLRRGSQFRPDGPPALNSPQYTAEFNEVKMLGGSNSTARTADQTQAGLFWMEASQITWNNLARQMAIEKGSSLMENARLFALLNLAGSDAAVAINDAKYAFNFWRPWAAVPLADQDGNPDTAADPTWIPMGAAPLPAHPDYVSQHTAYGAAAATVLASFFGSDNIPFSLTTSSAPNGVTRSFRSFSQAAAENGSSRIWIGWHFRSAVRDGLTLGRQVGHWVVDESLQPVE